VALSQADVRELQLAKGAVAAGFMLLLDGRRLTASRIFLGGAFRNYIRGESARRIGLLPSWADHPTAAGNTALRGARMLLLAVSRRQHILDSVLASTDHVELAQLPQCRAGNRLKIRVPSIFQSLFGWFLSQVFTGCMIWDRSGTWSRF